MRKDVLMRKWSEKVRFCNDYEIKVIALADAIESEDDYFISCFADLYLYDDIEDTEEIYTIQLTKDEFYDTEIMPAKMRKKALDFVDYFNSRGLFIGVVTLNTKVIFA